MKLITDKAALVTFIGSIETRGSRLDKDIQRAALSVINHHANIGKGDVTLINRLVSAMPNGSRVNALRDFIQTFSGASYDDETKLFVHTKGKKANLAKATEVMWTEFSPEKGYKPVEDAAAMLASLVKKLEADRKKMGAASKVDPAFIAALKAVPAANTIAA
jgi:hypothetical protein